MERLNYRQKAEVAYLAYWNTPAPGTHEKKKGCFSVLAVAMVVMLILWIVNRVVANS
jgi:hypothetical protein